MNTYLTTHPSPSLGRWLVMLAVGLVMLAIAYTHAPDPAWQLGLQAAGPHPLAQGHSVLRPSSPDGAVPPSAVFTAQPLASSQPDLLDNGQFGR